MIRRNNKTEANDFERSQSQSQSQSQGGKKKRRMDLQPKIISLEKKREIAYNVEKHLEKQIQDLKTWTDDIERMNDEQLKEYLKNRPTDLKTVKIQSSTKAKLKVKVKRASKSKYTGIIASVLKFHKKDNEDGSASPKSNA